MCVGDMTQQLGRGLKRCVGTWVIVRVGKCAYRPACAHVHKDWKLTGVMVHLGGKAGALQG